ncbi:MAG TPA: hypothetical protein VFL97_03495 [Nitrococcus sp.]|nr:hypothetical protein [Nitrococcus sp.]
MRAFHDRSGRRWEAVVGRESYGIQLLLFLPEGGGQARKTVMASTTRLEAYRELDAMSDTELCERLGHSQSWDADTLFPG